MADEQKVERRNFVLNFLEGALFASSGPLTSAQTVLPALVVKLGGSNVAVGAVGVVMWVGLFLPQIFSARYVETLPWKKPWAITCGAAQRVMMLLLCASLFFFGEHHPSVALLLLFVFYTLNQVLLGVTTPGWFDMFAKMTPTRKRGRLIGIRSSLGGLGAFCCGLLLAWLLTNVPFPYNFAVAFGIAFVLQSLSLLVQTYLIETEPSPVVNKRPLFAFVRELPEVLKTNRAFTMFLVAAIFQVLAATPAGFYTVYALSEFHADESFVGTFTLAMVLAQVTASFGIGFLADKYGNKTSLVIASVALLCANVWALAAPSVGWFIPVYVFLGINLGTELLARYNIAVEYAPPAQRSTYVGLMNTLIAPFYLAGLLAGEISDHFGYQPVLWAGTIASLVGFWLMTCRVQDPRTQEFTTLVA
jgi:MFS family permease